MSDLGKPELETQNWVIALFRNELRCPYAGDWAEP